MIYADARPLIKSGDMLAWSHRGWGSWHSIKIQFVRMFTRSEYSHVGTAWVVGDRVFVIEAVQPKVRIYPLSKLLADGAYWLQMNAPWYAKTLTTALEIVGDNYSQIQAMQSPFWVPPEDSLWECAELVATIAKCDGIDLGYEYTPSAVVKAAQKIGAPIVLITK